MFFFFNDTATTEIYTLSLHDALPISRDARLVQLHLQVADGERPETPHAVLRDAVIHHVDAFDPEDRKSTRLNSSHSQISYAVFCLKKKKQTLRQQLASMTAARRNTRK